MSPGAETPLTDPKLAAAAQLVGGHLCRVMQDGSGRLTFCFEGLPARFVEGVFNGELTVNLRDYMNALDQVHGLIAQYRARRGR